MGDAKKRALLLADNKIATKAGWDRGARELDQLMALRGKPATIVSDNGTELTSNAILTWADRSCVGWHYIAPGEPAG